MMFPEPEYAQNIIVGVIFQHRFAWYVTDKEYWYLDYPKFDRASQAPGPPKTYPNDSYRFGIPVLNETTAERFLARIANHRIPAAVLSQMMISRKTTNPDDDLLDFAPCLLINFDQRQLSSQYPEMIRFERYIPDGWTGSYRNFLAELSPKEQYWIVGGHNLYSQS